MVTNMISQLQESFPLRRFRFAHLWEILSATENEICIPARPFNIYYLSVEPVLTLKPLKSDYHLISPYNVTLESNIKVMRIKEMITN